MQLSVKQYGDSKANQGDIILIHGTGARAEMWQPQIDLLVSLGYRCIVPDLRGHGESHEPQEKTDIHVHMQDLLETLEGLDVRFPAVFAGHSLGSIISIELAHRRPEMFAKILAVSMPGKVPNLTVKTFRLLLGWPYRQIKDTHIHRNLGWRERVLIDTDHFSLSQIVENFAHLNYTKAVPPVTCPVHFTVGRLDVVAPYASVKAMHKIVPNSTFHVIEWAGHNCMDSQTKKFNQWFLEKLKN
ncbi:MAG: alpha/beta hydrolase [Candidatus Obscuribacterales bacterium]|nr:alpha/beta hydrolase [Candidatus Obscuribacterales bacterium]